MDARDLEVRCEWCDAGFAAGTRTCVHCGRALGRRRLASDGAGLLDADAGTNGEEDEQRIGGFWSNILPGLAALAFIILSYLLRACERG